MVLPRPGSGAAADGATPACARRASKFRLACRVRASDATFPKDVGGTCRLYGLPDHQDVRAGVGDAPLTGNHTPIWDANRGGGGPDGDQSA